MNANVRTGVRELEPESNKPITILFLASELGSSSASAQMCRLASAFPGGRFSIVVVVVGHCDADLAGALQGSGVPVHHVRVRHFFDVSSQRKLRQLLASIHPAVIHAWGATATRLTRLLVNSTDTGNTPRVVVSAAAGAGGGISGWLVRRGLRRADRVVPMSLPEGERYHKLGVLSERLTRIAPCVAMPGSVPDGEQFRRDLGVPPHAPLIFAAGRLETASQFKSAIWAFDILRYEAPDCHLVICGDGPERAALEAFGRALAFDDFRVRFPGHRADVPELLGLADVVFVTQLDDGMNVALEAMAAGKPVVAWNSAELAEVIEDGVTGFLAAPGERAQLAGKAYPILHEPGLAEKLGTAGRERAIEHFSVARAVEHFTQLYGELCERPV